MAMAKGTSTMAVVVAVGAVAALYRVSEAFLAPMGPRQPPAAGASRFLGGAGTDAAAERAPRSLIGGAAAAMASLGVAALAVARLVEGVRGRRSDARVSRRADAKFAGGLLGGQSAFSSGDYNFDPLGLAAKFEDDLPWLREAELKHGRVCMLAWVGLVVPELVRIPGPESCYSASVVDAYKACLGQDGTGPLLQVTLFCGFAELTTTFAKWRIPNGISLENAGDYQLGLNFLPKDELKAKEMKLKELKNGRLAMLAFGGAITQAVLTGNGFPWLYSERTGARRGPGLASGVQPASKQLAARNSAGVTRHAESGYKMSKAVPFLPVSPALEGYVGGDEEGFDPMGFSLAIDIRWLRESELKHGRVAMLAVAGWIATDVGLRVPGAPFQVSTLAAHDAMVKFGSMTQLLFWIGCAELIGFLAFVNMMESKTDRVPGDFNLRLLYPQDAQGQKQMQLKELRNGRLAMLAFGGCVTAGVLTGKAWPFLDATRTPPRGGASVGAALCGGLQGARARGSHVAARGTSSFSVPFLPKPENLKGLVGAETEFDPLGFSDTFDVKWLRESELKHGRVCMLASVGFVAQQFIALPDMPLTPNALQAVSTAPASGMATLLFLAGYIESASYGGKITMLDMFEGGRDAGNFEFGSSFLKGKSEKEVTEMKLKELQNGRLAMLAFAGMVHHNLAVKGPLFPLFPDGWEGPQGTFVFIFA